MNLSLQNKIRTVEPQNMLFKVVFSPRKHILDNKIKVSTSTRPVPPRVERYISQFLSRSEVYYPSIQCFQGSTCMEAIVASSVDLTE